MVEENWCLKLSPRNQNMKFKLEGVQATQWHQSCAWITNVSVVGRASTRRVLKEDGSRSNMLCDSQTLGTAVRQLVESPKCVTDLN